MPRAKLGRTRRSSSPPILLICGTLPLESPGAGNQFTVGSDISLATDGSSVAMVAGKMRSPAMAWAWAAAGIVIPPRNRAAPRRNYRKDMIFLAKEETGKCTRDYAAHSRSAFFRRVL